MANGLSKGMTLQNIADKHNVDMDTLKQELKKGIKVEKEHTDDVKHAARIAMDHLFEDPKYYTKLAKVNLEEFEEIPDVEAVETVDVSKGFVDYKPQSLNIGEEIYYSFNGKEYYKGKVVNRPSAAKPNVYTIKNTNGVPTVVIYGGDRTNIRLKKPSAINEGLNKDLVKEFMKHVMNELHLEKLPKIELSNNSQDAIDLRSWGGYMPQDKSIHIVIANRHAADIFRTLAHELVHYQQDTEGRLKPDSGKTGSEEENEANSKAAIIMRNFAQAKPNLFEHLLVESSFSWKFGYRDDKGNYYYKFKSPKENYTVSINGEEFDGSYNVSFYTEGEFGKDTDEGVAIQVMSTVGEIIEDFIKKADPVELIFRPIKTKTDVRGGGEDLRRYRVYKNYLPKILPSEYQMFELDGNFHWMKK